MSQANALGLYKYCRALDQENADRPAPQAIKVIVMRALDKTGKLLSVGDTVTVPGSSFGREKGTIRGFGFWNICARIKFPSTPVEQYYYLCFVRKQTTSRKKGG